MWFGLLMTFAPVVELSNDSIRSSSSATKGATTLTRPLHAYLSALIEALSFRYIERTPQGINAGSVDNEEL